MKAIRNSEHLLEILSNESENWQEIIFNKTNVILLLNKNPILFGNCGYIDLDMDSEYRYISKVDETEYIEIHSIRDIIDYILNMPSYHKYLKDISYGEYTKSELFWAIYDRVIFAPQNLKLKSVIGETLYGLYTISEYNGELELDMAVVDRDAVCLSLPLGLTLNETLNSLVKKLNECAVDIEEPLYTNRVENDVRVPKSYEELLKKLENGAEFAWLL